MTAARTCKTTTELPNPRDPNTSRRSHAPYCRRRRVRPAAALVSPVHAGWYVNIHGTTDSLSWKGADGQALDLSSKDGKGIKVVKIAPDGRDGLHQGDLVTAVGDRPTDHVVDLLAYANAHMQDPATLSVQRNGRDLDVVLEAGQLGALVHPHP